MQALLKNNPIQHFFLSAVFLLFLCLSAASAQENLPEQTIQWQQWSDKTFALAQEQDKLVLLDITAKWCQFCKKMAAVTYQDAEVIKIINKHYIAVKADIEEDNTIQQLYGSFGVPGTIILSADKKELNKRLGYISPQQMQWHLLGNLQDAPVTSIANNK